MTEEKKPGGEIVDELHALGEQLVTAVKSLWDSEDARKVRQEIGDGFVELSHQVDDAIKRIGLTGRKLQNQRNRIESFFNHGNGAENVGADTVKLVDKGDCRDVILNRMAPLRF